MKANIVMSPAMFIQELLQALPSNLVCCPESQPVLDEPCLQLDITVKVIPIDVPFKDVVLRRSPSL